MSALCQKQTFIAYSISSSAATSKLCGMVRPSVLATPTGRLEKQTHAVQQKALRVSILGCPLNAIPEKAGGASVSPAIKTELLTRLPQPVSPGPERISAALRRAQQW